MNIYKKWGYISNPFKPSPLKSNEEGSLLLLGREKEKEKLKSRILSNSGIVSIEGENGIGKTSLVNVTLFEIFQDCFNQGTTELYIPCLEHFQLSRDCNIKEFSDRIIFSLAQTLIKYSPSLKKIKKANPDLKFIDTWLNTPETQSISAQISIIGGAGETREINTSEGFLKSGFKKQIIDWISTLFPNAEDGGIICMIDNLELLKTSDHARETMEVLRDELFTLNGIKWIFSGSHGIIKTITSSPRMSGYLLNPIELGPLKSAYVSSLLSSRINSFQNHIDKKPYIPIRGEDFVTLFKSLRGNIRETFKKITSYYLYIAELENEPYFSESKAQAFKKWIFDDQKDVLTNIKTTCNVKDLGLLKIIKVKKQDFDINDIKRLGFVNINEVLSSINMLEAIGLIIIPIYEQIDIKQLQVEYGKLKIDESKANELFDDYLFKIFSNVLIAPKGYYIEEHI